MDADRAIAVISDFIAANPGSADAYVMRGLKHFGRGARALAINDFLKALEIQPDSVAARTALDSANSILDFYHKDLFNPYAGRFIRPRPFHPPQAASVFALLPRGAVPFWSAAPILPRLPFCPRLEL